MEIFLPEKALVRLPSSIIAFWKDHNLVYRAVTQLFLNGLNLNSAREVVGKTDVDLNWTKKQLKALIRYDRTTLEDAESTQEFFEFPVPCQNENQPLLLRRIPIMDSRGSATGLIGVIISKEESSGLANELTIFRDLFEKAPMGIFQTSLEGKAIRLNPAMATILGFDSVQECLEADIDLDTEFYTHAGQRRKLVAKLLKHDKMFDIKSEFNKKDSGRFNGKMHLRIARKADGSVRFIEGFLEDITRQKSMKKALQESEKMYRTLVENTGTGTIVVDEDMTIIKSNVGFEKISGYSKYEMEGKMKWTALVHSDDLERMKRYHVNRRQDAASAPTNYEFKIYDRTGILRDMWVQTDMVPDSKISVASCLDITAHKRTLQSLRESEYRLNSVIQAFEGFIYITTQCYRLEFVNQSLMEHMGRNGIGGTCYREIYRQDAPCSWCPMDQVSEGRSVRKENLNPLNGRWYYTISTPVSDTKGHVSQMQSMIIDIHERKMAEESLKKREAYLRQENIRLRSDIKNRYRFGAIIGKSHAMQNVYEMIIKAAASEDSAIINGESGTGKELVARAIHDMSNRRDQPFVPVNCGAISQNLIESEFFGYVKGAFTGAHADRPGFLLSADQGTLFLDEIADIDLMMQVKLLRAIEGGGFTPVGGNRVLKPNVRIIAATNRDLKILVQERHMRDDFFYRIHVLPVHLPPLRERKEDIPLLAEHFLSQYDKDNQRIPLDGKLLESLQNYDWPGNVRELQNTLKRYVTLKKLDFLQMDSKTSENIENKMVQPLRNAVLLFEKNYIINALNRNQWRRNRAAEDLGINRKTLYKKMQLYKIKEKRMMDDVSID